MKSFFTAKRIVYLAIVFITLVTLVILLIVPIGSRSDSCFVYSTYSKVFGTYQNSYHNIKDRLTTPFSFDSFVLVAQTVVFTAVSVIFLVFLALFIVDLVKTGAFKRHPRSPSKVEQLEKQVADLQKQVDELKKND
ncbi:MAG: FlxA-like family protein [Clostridiales bacterium]|nr:FlxA-like family protein [Clostridiales bacterium]